MVVAGCWLAGLAESSRVISDDMVIRSQPGCAWISWRLTDCVRFRTGVVLFSHPGGRDKWLVGRRRQLPGIRLSDRGACSSDRLGPATIYTCSTPSSGSGSSRWRARSIRTRIWPRPNGASARPPAAARRSSACRSCSARNISAARRMPRCFDLAEPVPGPTTESLSRLARELAVVIIGSGLRAARARASTTTPPLVIDADGALLGMYRKMHIPDDPLYYEKYLLHARRPGLPLLRHALRRASAPLICWDQWYPEARAPGRAGRARRCCSTPPPSAGTRPRRREYGAAQHDAWRTIQRAPRHRQRRLRGRGQPRGLRRAAGARPGILGRLVRGRSVRPGAGRSRATTARRL